MNLIIDVGNTQFKFCVFSHDEIIHSSFSDEFNQNVYEKEFSEFPIKRCIFSSTRLVSISDIKNVIPKGIEVIELNQNTKLPITINYKTPNTLGKDRIAAAAGAYKLFTNAASLIIDIGTALTIDFIDKEGVFQGGIISPGPETRYKALNAYTEKLPLLKSNKIELALQGKSTDEAINFGVQNGILFEINEYILRYSKQYKELNVLLTGGYAYLFDKKINYPIFAELFLVPIGLNRILEYNDN